MMIVDEYHYTLYSKAGKDRKNRIYYYAYKDETGKWQKRSTGCTNERKARAYVNKLIAEGSFRDTPVSKNLTFREFAEKYRFWIYDECPIVRDAIARKGHYSKENCKSNGDCMRKHIYPTFGDVMLSRITKAMINNWIICLPAAANLRNKSVNAVRITLYQMLQYAADEGLVKRELVLDKAKPLSKHAKTRPAFTQDQITAIFAEDWKNHHAYVGCRLSSLTGMRLGEVRALTAEQVFPDHIVVNASWSDEEGRKATKSGKPREIPISPEVYEMLRQIIYKPGLIFSVDGNVPVGEKFFNGSLRKRMGKLNIEYAPTDTETSLSFHSFRHYFNTRLVAAGVNAEIIRAIIGHEDEKMTENYTHLQIEDKQKVSELQSLLFTKVA